MKSTFLKSTAAVVASALLASCDPNIDTPTPTADGKIDLSNYVAIGNSLTAGYASNGLYLEGQKVAYPVLIAQQFKLAGGSEFNAPLFSADQANGTGYLKLTGFVNPTTPILISVPRDPSTVLGKSAFAFNASLNPDSVILKPYVGPKNHNWGVPGIRVADIETPGYGFPNAYFGRMLQDAEKPVVTYAAKILEQKPTFFSLWLGNNDVLGFSTSGGSTLVAQVTPEADFSLKYKGLVSALVNQSQKPKGVLANIPDVTSIPFFTTIGPSVKASLKASNVPAFFEFKFDSVFTKVATILANPISPGVTIIDTTKGSPILVNDIASLGVSGNFEGNVFFTFTFSPYASLIGKPGGAAWRNIVKTLMRLYNIPPAAESAIWAHSGLDTTKLFGLSYRNPIPDIYVLNGTESALARSTVNSYNNIIKSTADEHGLAYVDANAFLGKITKGSYFDGISTNASFLSGGVFSLDGVHLTPRGNAIAANEFIKAINNKYGTKITVLNVGQYKGVTFP